MHGAFRISQFWKNIPQYTERAHCASCNPSHESLDHILIDCDKVAISTIWTLVKQTWPNSFGQWPEIHLGLILGCGGIPHPHQDNDNSTNSRPSRLLCILISESAHLICAPLQTHHPGSVTFNHLNQIQIVQQDQPTPQSWLAHCHNI